MTPWKIDYPRIDFKTHTNKYKKLVLQLCFLIFYIFCFINYIYLSSLKKYIIRHMLLVFLFIHFFKSEESLYFHFINCIYLYFFKLIIHHWNPIINSLRLSILIMSIHAYYYIYLNCLYYFFFFFNHAK